jgi:hypothetical protein
MNSHQIRWLIWAVILVSFLALLALHVLPGANSPKVAGTFLSYTNGGSRTFVVVTFANHERVPIHWHDVWVQQGDSMEHHAPVMNPGLPWISKPSLEVGDSETLAVGKPAEKVRWRVCWEYSPEGSTNIYTARSQWFEP